MNAFVCESPFIILGLIYFQSMKCLNIGACPNIMGDDICGKLDVQFFCLCL